MTGTPESRLAARLAARAEAAQARKDRRWLGAVDPLTADRFLRLQRKTRTTVSGLLNTLLTYGEMHL